MRVTASQRAQHDLDEILETISASNGRFVATKWRQQILDALDLLELFSGAGSPRPRLGTGVRVLPLRPWLIYYVVEADQVLIKRIVHGARRQNRKLVSEE